MNIAQVVTYSVFDLVSLVWRFPVWWYSQGLVRVLKAGSLWIRSTAAQLSVKVWLKNLFVPMYGLRDWQSRLISVFIRTVQIFARGFMLFVWTVLILCGWALYLVLPLVLVAGIILSLAGVTF